MHRNRTWQIDPEELRTQRNRILAIEGGDGYALNLDFTTGVLDPRVGFARGTSATFVNSSGFVEYAANNQMTQSQSQDSETFWNRFGTNVVRTAGQTDPNGGTGAVKLEFDASAGDAVISRTVPTSIGLPYTISIWMRSDSGTLTNVRFARAATPTGAFFPTLTTTWQRVSLSFTASGTGDGMEIRVLSAGSPQTAKFHVYGAQLESGSTVRNYQPALAAVAYYAPRFDYSPTNIGQLNGLLIEGQGINISTRSEDFANADWTKDNSVGSSIAVVSTVSAATPANGTSVNQIVFSRIVGGFSRVSRTSAGIASAPYTMSVWLRTVSGTANVGLRIGADSAGFNCAVTTTWQRFKYTFTLSSTDSSAQIMLWENIVGNDLTATVYAWGCQVEAGSGASSYIPTGASAFTRNADHCTIPTASFISGNPYPQTLFVDCIPNTPSVASLDIVRIYDRTAGGTFSYGTEIYYSNASTMTVGRKITASTNTDRSLASGLAYGTRHKFALSINASSFSGSRDGVTGLGVATAPTALATVATHLGIGCTGDASAASVMFGTIRQIKFYPTALSQSEINTLTAL